MANVTAFGQVSGSTAQVGLAAFPAGSTLLKARLACYTWFASDNGTYVFQQAPPNTLLGISWRPSGNSPELVSTSNWSDSTWYASGPGELDVFDRWTYVDTAASPPHVYLQHVYANHLEREGANYQANAYSVGLSINFLGGGYWTNVVPWISYQFEAWYD